MTEQNEILKKLSELHTKFDFVLSSPDSPHLNPLPKGEEAKGENNHIEYIQKKYNPKYITQLAKDLRKF